MLQLDVKLGEIWDFSPLIFVRGHFQEIGIAALFWGWSYIMWKSFENVGWRTDVGESELTDEKEETCTRSRSQNGRSKMHLRIQNIVSRTSLNLNHGRCSYFHRFCVTVRCTPAWTRTTSTVSNTRPVTSVGRTTKSLRRCLIDRVVTRVRLTL